MPFDRPPFFENNAVAVVRLAAGISPQLVEDQSVGHAQHVLGKAAPGFLLKKKIAPFFQKNEPEQPRPDVKRANRKAKAALLFGLLGCAMFVPAVIGGSSVALVLMIVYPIPAILLGLIAMKEKTTKGMAAAWGICLGLFSWVLVKLASHSFKEYILIEQDQPEVETRFREEPDLWRESFVNKVDGAVFLKSLGCSVLMADIYENIVFG